MCEGPYKAEWLQRGDLAKGMLHFSRVEEENPQFRLICGTRGPKIKSVSKVPPKNSKPALFVVNLTSN
jgi:hypothetical protein